MPGFIGGPVVGAALAVDLGLTLPPTTTVSYVWQVAELNGTVVAEAYGPTYTPVAADRGLILSLILTPFNGTTVGAPFTLPGLIVQ